MIFKRQTRTYDFDLIVIGGGSAAFAAAIRAHELGARVGLVERGTIGGTCVNRGCIPSKFLLHAAELYHIYRTGGGLPGLPRGEQQADFRQVVQAKHQLVASMRKAKYEDVLASYPQIEYIQGHCRFLDETRVEVQSGGEARILTAPKFIIATGASPKRLPIPGLDQAKPLTYESAMELEELPPRLLVIGAGPVGLELGQVFLRFGSQVTVVELMPQILPAEEPEIAATLQVALEDEGMKFFTRTKVTAIEKANRGYVAVLETDGHQQKVEFDRVLLAAGLKANTEELNLEAAGVATDPQGFIQVDESLRTSAKHVWAAGDCTGKLMLVTVAAEMGNLCAENALEGSNEKLDFQAIPHAVFTDPEVASVGLREEQARAVRRKVEVRLLTFEHVPRAGVTGQTMGAVKLVVDGADYRLLGVHIAGQQASELIHTATLTIRQKLTVGDLVHTIFVYPTFSEALKLAAISFQKDVTRLSCCAH